MTIEFTQLSAQILGWLNRRVARHLAAEAARLTRENGTDGDKQTVHA
jgi:hypothetical protein